MNSVNQMIKIAEKECESHGVPITEKRVKVLSILQLLKKAISAYEIVELYERFFKEPVPVITVYRVLDFLQNKSLVHKLETANKFVACTHIDCNHKHQALQFLICKECLKVKELSMSHHKFNELLKTIEHAGFHLDKPQLEMDCICDTCYANKE